MRFALLLSLLISPASAQDWFNRDQDDLTPQEKYELGLKYMKRGYYVKAQEQFNELRNKHRDDPYAVKAELALADMHYKQNEWDLARLAYKDFLRHHPRHEDVDYVVYRLGMTAWKKAPKIAARDQTWTKQAVNTWTGFSTRFPESEHREEVEEMLAQAEQRLAHKEFVIGKFYYQRDAWTAVEGRMEPLVVTYPESKDVPDALYMLAHALYEKGEIDRAKAATRKLVEDYPDTRAVKKLQREVPELFEDLPVVEETSEEAS